MQVFVDRCLCSVRLFYTWVLTFVRVVTAYLGLLLASRGLEFLHLYSSWTFILLLFTLFTFSFTIYCSQYKVLYEYSYRVTCLHNNACYHLVILITATLIPPILSSY